jgi:outer membrane protein assembly factor BamB
MLSTALVLALGCAHRDAGTSSRGWPAFLHDGSRSNASPDAIELPLAAAWRRDLSYVRFIYPFPREQTSAPAIYDGVVYAGSANGRLYALDIASGVVLWRFDAGRPIDAPPSVADGSVCFGSSDGVLRCLDARTGAERMGFRARSEILSSPVIVGGAVYFSSSDDRLYAVSADAGQKIWSLSRSTAYKTVAPRLHASPAYHEGRLYHLFSDGTLAAVSADTGRELWARKVIKDFDSTALRRRTPLVRDGMVYVIDGRGTILTLDAATGKEVGALDIIEAVDFVIPERRAMVAAGADRLVAVDPSSGAILWKTDIGKGRVSSILAAGGHILVLSNYDKAPLGLSFLARRTGRIQAFSLKDGGLAWADDLTSGVTAGASSAGGMVALLADAGALEVFGPR